MVHLNEEQFRPPGDDDAKAGLLSQLKGSFPKEARQWLKDDRVRVDAPARVDPNDIDWEQYPEWRASRQLKDVRKKAKKIDGGKEKPIVLAQRPGSDTKDILDGHHKAMGYVDAKKQPLAYVVHVPHQTGPWNDMHDQQNNDKKQDDFGKTKKKDLLG
jgi:hypothetical protein